MNKLIVLSFLIFVSGLTASANTPETRVEVSSVHSSSKRYYGVEQDDLSAIKSALIGEYQGFLMSWILGSSSKVNLTLVNLVFDGIYYIEFHDMLKLIGGWAKKPWVTSPDTDTLMGCKLTLMINQEEKRSFRLTDELCERILEHRTILRPVFFPPVDTTAWEAISLPSSTPVQEPAVDLDRILTEEESKDEVDEDFRRKKPRVQLEQSL